MLPRKSILKIFSCGCHGNQSFSWNSKKNRNLHWAIISIILMKFGENPSSSFIEEDVDRLDQQVDKDNKNKIGCKLSIHDN